MFRPVLVSLGGFAVLAAGSMLAGGHGPLAPASAAAMPAQAVANAESGTERMTDAVAAALVESIGRQFEAADVVVQLDRVRELVASERDRQLRGSGRLRLDGDSQWIGFEFAALYDTETGDVAPPRLQLERSLAAAQADAAMARKLEARVAAALAEEFAGQPVAWTQGVTTSTQPGGRFVRLSGAGVADFGAEGRVDARVEALYDRVAGRWIRVSYELGEPSHPVSLQGGVARL